MTPYSPGDVVLVRFPFTDFSSTKRRPAVVLSPAAYSGGYGDVVLLGLTSQVQVEDALRLTRWQEAGLPKPTWLKPLIATVAMHVVETRLGTLANDDRATVRSALTQLIAPVFLG